MISLRSCYQAMLEAILGTNPNNMTAFSIILDLSGEGDVDLIDIPFPHN